MSAARRFIMAQQWVTVPLTLAKLNVGEPLQVTPPLSHVSSAHAPPPDRSAWPAVPKSIVDDPPLPFCASRAPTV
jgi:hypothetical protein